MIDAVLHQMNTIMMHLLDANVNLETGLEQVNLLSSGRVTVSLVASGVFETSSLPSITAIMLFVQICSA